jgi:hypothetical protein
MHGPACILWANLTPFSLQRCVMERTAFSALWKDSVLPGERVFGSGTAI